jgi:hypothetical protein
MTLMAKSTGKSIDPIDPGIHPAICTAVYDLGTQYNEHFKVSTRQVLIQWELPTQRIQIVDQDTNEERDMPRATSEFFTLSLHEKSNLRRMLEGWRGVGFTEKELDGFDLLKLLSVNCQIQIIHNKTDKGTYANIAAIFPLPKEQWSEPENPLRSFSFNDDHKIPDGCPEWIEKIIHASEEWQKIEEAGYQTETIQDPSEHGEDDIPF